MRERELLCTEPLYNMLVSMCLDALINGSELYNQQQQMVAIEEQRG